MSVVPIVVCAVLALRYAYDAPYWDEWSYVEPVSRAFEGTLRPADFWVRNNEHILFTSSLIVIPLARLTHWDMRFEVLLTVFFFAAAFGFLARIASRAERIRAGSGSIWVWPLIAMMMFSPSQHAIWSWGLHLCIGLAVFLIFAALGALVRVRLTAGSIAAAVFLSGRGDVPEYAPRATAGMTDYFVYVLAYIGGPLVPYSGHLAFVAGTGFMVVAGFLAVSWAKPNADRIDVFLLGLLTVGMTVGMLTAIKHAHEGPANAVSSRFLPWPTLSWCAVLIAWYRAVPRLGAASWRTGFAAAMLGVVLVCGWLFGAYTMDERHDAFLYGRRALVEDSQHANLSYLHPRWRELGPLREKLIEHRLTVFRERRPKYDQLRSSQLRTMRLPEQWI